MALFCWIFDALVNPMDEFRNFGPVIKGLIGLSPGRSHALRGRIVFMESHDTATSDRYGRVPAAVHKGKSFLPESDEAAEGGDAFQKAGDALEYPEVEAVEANRFAAGRAALGLVLVMTAPGVPMLLQGQEVCDCRPYKWPNGPALDWSRVESTNGPAAEWKQLCRDLIALRLLGGKLQGSPDNLMACNPFQGDGVHTYHSHEGVLAYLRWAEPEDSRSCCTLRHGLALVVVNCTHRQFDKYTLGVPPSKSWRIVLSTSGGETSPSNLEIEVSQNTACHDFPCAISIPLDVYSAVILLQQN
eukprot:TRINITY_DN113142_c0_g1_i1.p1 TRINITY_DN113142_c0_g1~~TRINITY_DN113142_c0_g1_i1.p1  ORF type:complete len:309 (+),score=46.52 TRINITY_DN113142_c0_g1_i1:25-927(+)